MVVENFIEDPTDEIRSSKDEKEVAPGPAKVSKLDVYMCTDVDKAVRILSSKITSILDKMAPMKTVQVRTNYNPWISQETKTLMLEG